HDRHLAPGAPTGPAGDLASGPSAAGGAAAAGDLPGGAVDGLAAAVQPRLADGAAAGCGGRDQHRGGHVRLPDPRPPRGSARPAGRRRLTRPGRRSDIPSRAIPWWTPAPGPARRSVPRAVATNSRAGTE